MRYHLKKKKKENVYDLAVRRARETLATLATRHKFKPWTAENELNAFNIKIETLDPDDFFHACGLPDPSVPATVLQNVYKPNKPIDDNEERLFFDYLDSASTTGEEVAMTADFAAFLLHWLGYDTQGRIVHQNKKAALTVCRQRPDVYFDVCVMSPERYYQLVVQAELAPVS
ncbi:hypothetical protein EST38_g7345 [Candolleomyces aberdarensis]|uniref:Uncharacterized protein n=1 Tax=Candolleomyces aberdarensis TaxID=2316362 RepID=A0A4Q2DI91_9AGAR|nr:hypothetical protein EST38_g7345 [Candolleomyces aberdarensis]